MIVNTKKSLHLISLRGGAAMAAIALLAGCSSQPTPLSATPQVSTNIVTCQTLAFQVETDASTARLFLPGQTRLLKRQLTTTGRLYAAESFRLRLLDQQASFTSPNGQTLQCQLGEKPNVWASAWAKGAFFRGVGQEPGWMFTLNHNNQIDLLWAYGQHHLSAPLPPPTSTAEGVTYHVVDQGHSIAITIEPQGCQGSMDGSQHDFQVQLTIDTDTFRGCGRGLVSMPATH